MELYKVTSHLTEEQCGSNAIPGLKLGLPVEVGAVCAKS